MSENKDLSKESLEALTEAMKKVWEERQNRPDQYVVAYYRLDNEELIGYHASTFCQITKELMDGKRYAGEDPYPQLAVIAKNIKSVLDKEPEGMFSVVTKSVQESFGGLKSNQIYMDAVYLAEGMPKQNFRYQIVTND